jgi:hypothetical protein
LGIGTLRTSVQAANALVPSCETNYEENR